MRKAWVAAICGSLLCVAVMQLTYEEDGALVKESIAPLGSNAIQEVLNKVDQDNTLSPAPTAQDVGKDEPGIITTPGLREDAIGSTVIQQALSHAKSLEDQLSEGEERVAFEEELKKAEQDCEGWQKDHYSVCAQYWCEWMNVCTELGIQPADPKETKCDSVTIMPENKVPDKAFAGCVGKSNTITSLAEGSPMAQCKCKSVKDWSFDTCEYKVKHVDQMCVNRYNEMDTFIAREKHQKVREKTARENAKRKKELDQKHADKKKEHKEKADEKARARAEEERHEHEEKAKHKEKKEKRQKREQQALSKFKKEKEEKKQEEKIKKEKEEKQEARKAQQQEQKKEEATEQAEKQAAKEKEEDEKQEKRKQQDIDDAIAAAEAKAAAFDKAKEEEADVEDYSGISDDDLCRKLSADATIAKDCDDSQEEFDAESHSGPTNTAR